MAPPWRILLLVGLYFLYLFLGATIFSAIEHPIEGRMLEELRDQKEKFLLENKCVEGESKFSILVAAVAFLYSFRLLEYLTRSQMILRSNLNQRLIK